MMALNDYVLSLILGVVEGLTEFLPISSTAHLRISEAFLGLSLENEYWKMFSVVIQLGAILSVVVYFRSRILDFLNTFAKALSEGERRFAVLVNHPLALTLVAFVVTAVPAFLLSKVIGKNLESLGVIGSSLLVGGVIMWVVDWRCRQPRVEKMEQMNLRQSVWIGLVQILSAVFPGTSRSMSTIAGGQLAGLSRSAALEFSFFLSIPTMVAATGYDLLKTILRARSGGPDAVLMGMHEWVVLGIGFVTSFVVAWAVIAWFMSWVRTRGFTLFAVYRIILGLGVLATLFL